MVSGIFRFATPDYSKQTVDDASNDDHEFYYEARIIARSVARDLETNSLYTIYQLDVIRSATEPCLENNQDDTYHRDLRWTVWRRYNDFKDLGNLLNKKNIDKDIPSIPGRGFFTSRFDPGFLNGRQTSLNTWLVKLLDRQDSINGLSNLVDFLTKQDQHNPIEDESSHGGSNYRESTDLHASANEEYGFSSRSGFPTTSARLSSSHASDGSSSDADSQLGNNNLQVSLADFQALRIVGRGSFGKVMVVKRKNCRQKENDCLYAMKILKKSNIKKRKQIEHTKTERRIMESLDNPFIVELHYAFQTKARLFLVLEFIPGGELFHHLGALKTFPEHWTRLWAAEMLLALEYLHSRDVIYRDLKPENVMLDADGHIRLIDFGLCKDRVSEFASGAMSFCGTPEYLAPEILGRKGHGKGVDIWNLGMVIFEMLTGLPPWYSRNKRKLFDRLRNAPLVFPDIVKEDARTLISALLIRDPLKRLGVNGFQDIKAQPFFKTINWEKLLRKEIKSPYRPFEIESYIERQQNGENDSPALEESEQLAQIIETVATNFDEKYTGVPIQDSDFSDDEVLQACPIQTQKAELHDLDENMIYSTSCSDRSSTAYYDTEDTAAST